MVIKGTFNEIKLLHISEFLRRAVINLVSVEKFEVFKYVIRKCTRLNKRACFL